jgi:chromosome segregation ATPase
MVSKLEETMHREHLAWKSENDLWLDEVRAWQYELYQVKSDARRLQASLESHEQALAAQAEAIREYKERIGKEERILAMDQACCDELPPPDARFAQEAKLHQQALARHDRVKRHHRQVMKQWLKLMNVLGEGM